MAKRVDTEPIRVLQFLPCLQAAGVENFVMNYYRHINKEKIQFDFVVHSKKPGLYDEEVKKLGGKIHYLTLKDDKNIFKYIKDLKSLFKNYPEYQIVHGNMQSIMPIYLHIAKKCGVKTRIAHAHMSYPEKSLKGFLFWVLKFFSKYQSTVNFACSDKAGKYLFRKKSFVFVPNAIETKKFKYDGSVRKNIRSGIKIPNNSLVVGNVGRLEKEKNQKRLLRIFKELNSVYPESVLLIFGEGKLKKKLIQLSTDLGINSSVRFMGVVEDLSKYYNVMDIFLFTSLHEGLPVSVVEAQAAGLPCVISDSVTKQVDIAGKVEYISLNLGDGVWTKNILGEKAYIDGKNRLKDNDVVGKSIFNIEIAVKKMEKFYLKCIGGER